MHLYVKGFVKSKNRFFVKKFFVSCEKSASFPLNIMKIKKKEGLYISQSCIVCGKRFFIRVMSLYVLMKKVL